MSSPLRVPTSNSLDVTGSEEKRWGVGERQRGAPVENEAKSSERQRGSGVERAEGDASAPTGDSPLGTLENGFRRRRRQRYRALELLRGWSSRNGARECMTAAGANVVVSGHRDGTVHVSGVKRCSSVHACPVCAPTIRGRRAVEIDQGVSKWIADGGTVWFVTATLPHDRGERLEKVLDELLSAWRRTWGGRPAQRQKELLEFAGSIKALEITHGANGWHPHLHSLLLCKGEQDPREWLSERWSYQVTKTGRRAPHQVYGLDVQRVEGAGALAKYLTKVEGGWGVGLELARADAKKAKNGGSNPWQLLFEASEQGDVDSLTLFLEYEAATKGRNALTWSPGLKGLLEVEEVTDEEAAIAEAETEKLVERVIPAEDWNRMVLTQRVCDLFEDVERELETYALGLAPP